MKALSYAMILFCFGYLIRAEWLVYQHYLVINRDYYPIMSEFHRMYEERVIEAMGQISVIVMGMRSQQFSRLVAAIR